MNIALIFQHRFVQGLQHWMQNATATRRSTAPQSFGDACLYTARPAIQRTDIGALAGAVERRHLAPKVMPLRVVRIVESGQPRCNTGRMVISGRMADVCAELDRLVEREAALH